MRRVLGGVILAVALVAGACGGDGTDPGQVVRAAASKTTAAESSRIALTVTGSKPDGTVTGEGAFEYATRRGTMTMELPGMGTMDAVLDGLVFYLKFPTEVAAQIPGGKPWVTFDLERLGKQAGFDLGQVAQAQQGDPTQALDYLRGASDDVKKVGTEDVRGVETTHYRATLDLSKAAAQLSGEQRKAIDGAISTLRTKTIPTDVWIDADGRARRLTYSTTKPKASVTIELFDFGVDVDASPPPPDQVTDLNELLGQAG